MCCESLRPIRIGLQPTCDEGVVESRHVVAASTEAAPAEKVIADEASLSFAEGITLPARERRVRLAVDPVKALTPFAIGSSLGRTERLALGKIALAGSQKGAIYLRLLWERQFRSDPLSRRDVGHDRLTVDPQRARKERDRLHDGKLILRSRERDRSRLDKNHLAGNLGFGDLRLRPNDDRQEE